MLKPLFTSREIGQALERLASEIRRDLDNEPIVFVCLLKGSFMFLADLIRHIENPSVIDFMRVSSYGNATRTSGEVRVTKDLETPLEGMNVVIVEDIIDSGLTLTRVRDMLLARRPKTLRICALLDKRARREVEIEADYVGFTIEDGFVVGYGIDLAEGYRNLPDICVFEEG